jgi:hypothetical protein
VTTRSQEKLATAKVSAPCSTAIEVQSVEHVQLVVPMKQDNKAATMISSVPQSDVVTAVVGMDVVEEAKPLNGLNMQIKRVYGDACMIVERGQRWILFQTQFMIKGKVCKLMVDGGSYCNGISKVVVMTLGLTTWRVPEPKHVAWLNSCGMLKFTHKVSVPFIVGDYVDEVETDVLPLEVCGLLRGNTYSFVHDSKQRTLKPMQDDQIKSDVELVVHKEKLRKAKPKSGLATLQPKEHDAWIISVAIVSAMPIDDKPVVLVSDKPVEVKPLLDERKNIAACSIVCVDKGVQTDAPCADRVSVQMPQGVEDRSFVRLPVRHFVGAAVRMHKGKDGHVRLLCGPGIYSSFAGSCKAGSCSTTQGSSKS